MKQSEPAQGYEDSEWIIGGVIFPGTDGENESEDDGKYDAYRAEQLKNISTVGGIYTAGVTELEDGNGGDGKKNYHGRRTYIRPATCTPRAGVDSANGGKGGYEVDTTNDRATAIWGNAYTNANSNNVDLEHAYFHRAGYGGKNAPDVSAVNHRHDPEHTGYIVIGQRATETLRNDRRDKLATMLVSIQIRTAFKDITDGSFNDYDDPAGAIVRRQKRHGDAPDAQRLHAEHGEETRGKWKNDDVSGKLGSVQYGTAANPLLTIINLSNQGVRDGISLSWEKLGLSGAGSLAALRRRQPDADGLRQRQLGRYYNGILFSEGDLSINAFHAGEASGADATHGINLGSGSRLYGDDGHLRRRRRTPRRSTAR